MRFDLDAVEALDGRRRHLANRCFCASRPSRRIRNSHGANSMPKRCSSSPRRSPSGACVSRFRSGHIRSKQGAGS